MFLCRLTIPVNASSALIHRRVVQSTIRYASFSPSFSSSSSFRESSQRSAASAAKSFGQNSVTRASSPYQTSRDETPGNEEEGASLYYHNSGSEFSTLKKKEAIKLTNRIRLFISNLSKRTREDELTQFVQRRLFGMGISIIATRLVTSQYSHRSRGLAYMDLLMTSTISEEQASELLGKLHQQELDQRNLHVCFAEVQPTR